MECVLAINNSGVPAAEIAQSFRAASMKMLCLGGTGRLPGIRVVSNSARKQFASSPEAGVDLVPNLTRTYEVVFTGSMGLPAPHDALNGRFVLNGSIAADGERSLVVRLTADDGRQART